MGLTFHCQLCQYCFSFFQRSAIHLIFYRRGWFPVSILVFYNSSISKLSITFYRYIFTVLNDFTFLRRVFFLKIFLHGDILMIWYCLSRVCLKIFLFYETSILFWAVENQNWTFTFFTLLTISYINESSYWCIHLLCFWKVWAYICITNPCCWWPYYGLLIYSYQKLNLDIFL